LKDLRGPYNIIRPSLLGEVQTSCTLLTNVHAACTICNSEQGGEAKGYLYDYQWHT
jgi:hypothetical protein